MAEWCSKFSTALGTTLLIVHPLTTVVNAPIKLDRPAHTHIEKAPYRHVGSSGSIIITTSGPNMYADLTMSGVFLLAGRYWSIV